MKKIFKPKKEVLSDELEKLKTEVDGQLEVLKDVEVGSEEQDIATKSLERTMKAYTDAVKAQSDISTNDTTKTTKWVQIGVNVLFNCLMILGGIASMKQIGILEAIDEANGEISSMAVRNQKVFTRNIIRDWMSGKGLKA